MVVTEEHLYEFVTPSLDNFGERTNCLKVRLCARARACEFVGVRARVCASVCV